MAHGIQVNANGKSEMAFAGELPWHGLGQRVNPDASIQEWLQAAGLDWSVETATVQYKATNEDRLRSFGDKRVLYRSDSGAALGVASDGYKPHQNAELLEFFRDLTGDNGYKIHTVGALNGGRRIWVMAKNGHEVEAAPGDRVRGNLLLATSHDGTLSTHGLYTAIRVVCANTLALALSRDGKSASKQKHSRRFDPATMKQALGLVDAAFAEFGKNAQALANKPISIDQARDILNALFKSAAKINDSNKAVIAKGAESFADLMQAPVAIADEPREHRAVGKVMDLFQGAGLGANHAGSAGTAWGLVNAVTQYVDHSQGRTADTRMNSAWFGQGAEVKQSAFEMLLAA